MFKRVMVATDLSLNADRLVARLSGLSKWGTKEIALAHASDFFPQYALGADDGARRALLEDRDRRMEDRLADQQRILEMQGFSVTRHLVLGRPQEVIARLAEEWGAELLVLGLRQAPLVRSIALGGTAFEILGRSNVPVLFVNPSSGISDENEHPMDRSCPCGTRILFPTDFSLSSEQAFLVLLDMVRCRAHDVTLFHVLSRGWTAVPETALRMEELRSEIIREGSVARIVLASGDPAVEILHACETLDVSWLVMGTQGKGAVGEYFLGSVSQIVARRTALPVLLARGTQEVRSKSTGLGSGKGRNCLRLRSHEGSDGAKFAGIPTSFRPDRGSA